MCNTCVLHLPWICSLTSSHSRVFSCLRGVGQSPNTSVKGLVNKQGCRMAGALCCFPGEGIIFSFQLVLQNDGCVLGWTSCKGPIFSKLSIASSLRTPPQSWVVPWCARDVCHQHDCLRGRGEESIPFD